MKPEEIRKNLTNELNMQYAKTGGFFDTPKGPDDPVISFPSPTFDKPKMFETKLNGRLELVNLSSIEQPIRGIGFKNTKITNEKSFVGQEIYNMKELIDSNPPNMKTFSYDTKTVKAQYALVKRKEWQDILFEDVDWFKQIDIPRSLKNFFNIK